MAGISSLWMVTFFSILACAAPALDHNGRFPDYGARQVPAMSVTDKDPHRLKVRYRDYLPVSL